MTKKNTNLSQLIDNYSLISYLIDNNENNSEYLRILFNYLYKIKHKVF